jgi:hypothetical protein
MELIQVENVSKICASLRERQQVVLRRGLDAQLGQLLALLLE